MAQALEIHWADLEIPESCPVVEKRPERKKEGITEDFRGGTPYAGGIQWNTAASGGLHGESQGTAPIRPSWDVERG